MTDASVPPLPESSFLIIAPEIPASLSCHSVRTEVNEALICGNGVEPALAGMR